MPMKSANKVNNGFWVGADKWIAVVLSMILLAIWWNIAPSVSLKLSSQSGTVLLAWFFFGLSLLVRCIRIYIAIGLTNLRPIAIIFAQTSALALGMLTVSGVQELILLLVLWIALASVGLANQWSRVFIALLVIRLADFFVLSGIIFIAGDQISGFEAHLQRLLFLGLGLAVVLFVVLIPATERLFGYYLHHRHNIFSLILVRHGAPIFMEWKKMRALRVDGLFLQIVFASVVWFFEYVALSLIVADGGEMFSSHALAALFERIGRSLTLHKEADSISSSYAEIYLFLVVATCLIAIWKLGVSANERFNPAHGHS